MQHRPFALRALSHWGGAGAGAKMVLFLAPRKRHYSAASGQFKPPLTDEKGLKLTAKQCSGCAAVPIQINGQERCIHRSFTTLKMLLAGVFLTSCKNTAPVWKPSGFHTGETGEALYRRYAGAIFSAASPVKRLRWKGWKCTMLSGLVFFNISFIKKWCHICVYPEYWIYEELEKFITKFI